MNAHSFENGKAAIQEGEAVAAVVAVGADE